MQKPSSSTQLCTLVFARSTFTLAKRTNEKLIAVSSRHLLPVSKTLPLHFTFLLENPRLVY
jgi:hypothetical protein